MEQRQPFAADDLYRYRAIEEVCVSPDGEHAVFVVREASRANDGYVTLLWRAALHGDSVVQ